VIPVPRSLRKIADIFDGGIYIVGGYVRNYLAFGSPLTTDVDICGKFTTEEIFSRLSSCAKVLPVNPRIGTLKIILDGDEYEYTTFRKDSYPIGGAHTPSQVEFVDSVQEDALRRDFTVNAIYYDVKKNEIVDPVGGIKDLDEKIIKTVNGKKTFQEDGLRLLRAVRFAASLGFELSPECFLWASSMATLLKDISSMRKRVELELILTADDKYGVKDAHLKGLELMSDLGLFEYLSATEIHFDKSSFSVLQYSPPNSRLDFFIRSAVLSNDEDPKPYIRNLLTELSFPTKTIKEQIYLSEFWGVTKRKELIVLLAKRPDLADRISALSRYNSFLICAKDVLGELIDKNVPLNVSELDVGGEDLVSLDIPKTARSHALNRVLETCLQEERRLTKDEQINLLKSFK